MTRELNLKMFRYFWPRHIYDMIDRFDTHVVGNRSRLDNFSAIQSSGMVSFFSQTKVRLKKTLPPGIYKAAVVAKRKLFGPRKMDFDYDA